MSPPNPGDRLDIAVLLDSPDEDWRAMDLAGEMLVTQWRSGDFRVTCTPISLPIPRIVRRLPGTGRTKLARNADRALVRYLAYPARALAARRPGRLFHVVDHSYAQVVHVLPAHRTGVYCHDIDVLRPVIAPDRDRRPPSALRALASVIRGALQSAAVVFHSTRQVGSELETTGVVPRSRLVLAPYGIAPEFTPRHDPRDGTDGFLAALGGHPYALHVGSEIERKRLDVLFEVFARLLAKHPALRLVQQGAALTSAQRAQIRKLGIGHALIQPPKLARASLAGLYRRASVVLVPSSGEGFGFPVIEAIACGATVVASDLPVLREVGADAALYAPLADVQAWTAIVDGVLCGSVEKPRPERCSQRARLFTWQEHARIILDAYRGIAKGRFAPSTPPRQRSG